MKKVILGALLLLSMCFVSCQSPQDKLISDCEENLKQNLKDPSSYERIDVKIKDTITSTIWAENLIKGDQDMIKDLGNDPIFLSSLDRSKVILDSVKKSKEPNKIREIIVEFKYRAKNSMGALDVERTGVEYLPDPTIFSKSKEDKFNLYEIK
jgi:hypothetical protein